MPDVLIRDVPADVVAAIDARAGALGLSRPEFLRRRLSQEALLNDDPVTPEKIRAFCDLVSDLGDPQVMAAAWE